MNQAALIAEIAATVLTGGRRTTALNVRSTLGKILDSYPNIDEGGQVFNAQVGYSSALTLTSPTAFAYKSWVENLVSSGAYVQKSGDTMSGNLLFSGGAAIDTTSTGGTDTLSVGGTNADVVNIGRAGATVNILGTVTNYQSTNANITDALITLNKGAGAGTAVGVGFEIEEASSITGYFKTNAARTGYVLRAPAVAFYADLSLVNLTANRTVTFQDASGTIAYLVDITVANLTGTVPINKGGTNSTAALNNNRMMISSGGAIVEHSAQVQNRVSVYNSNGLPTGYSTFVYDGTYLGVGQISPASKIEILGAGVTASFDGIRMGVTGLAHGVTDVIPAHIYSYQTHISAAGGGYYNRAFTGADSPVIMLDAIAGVTSPTVALLKFQGNKRTGTTYTSLANSEKLAEFVNSGTPVKTIMASGATYFGGSTTPSAYGHFNASTTVPSIKLAQADLASIAANVHNGSFEFTSGNVLNFIIGSTRHQIVPNIGLTDGDKGDITVSLSGATWTIDNDVVTYAKMQNISATSRFLGRITSGAGDTEELTGTQATTLLNVFTTSLQGLAPASGGGTTNFLRADGAWAAPPDVGVTTMGALGSVPNANGASISGVTLTLQPANPTYGGYVSTVAQNFSGIKGFDGIEITTIIDDGIVIDVVAGLNGINITGAGKGVLCNVTGTAADYTSFGIAGKFTQTGTLLANSTAAGLGAYRSYTLGAFDATAPVFEINDSTLSTGDLLKIIKGANTHFEVYSTGKTDIRTINVTTANAGTLNIINTGTGSNYVEASLLFTPGLNTGAAGSPAGRIYGKWEGVAQGDNRITIQSLDNAGTYFDTLTTKRLNVSIGGFAERATTVGTNSLQIFNGTAPVGTLANGCSFYSTAGEMRVMDAAGNATLLSPHEKGTNNWIYDSMDTETGKRLIIQMELMMKAINKKFGWDFIKETNTKKGA